MLPHAAKGHRMRITLVGFGSRAWTAVHLLAYRVLYN
jgi:hypothetical protein